jgi:hypothetical protein
MNESHVLYTLLNKQNTTIYKSGREALKKVTQPCVKKGLGYPSLQWPGAHAKQFDGKTRVC